MNIRVVEQTHEITQGEWIYRIVWNAVDNTALLKRVHVDRPNWFCGGDVQCFDGVVFQPVIQSYKPFYFEGPHLALDIISKQEG